MTTKRSLSLMRVLLFILAVFVVSATVVPVLHNVYSATDKTVILPLDKTVVVPTAETHIDLFKTIIGGLIVIVGFFFVRTLKGFDDSNKAQILWMQRLELQHNDLKSNFDKLQAVHDERIHCHVRKEDL